MKSKKRPYLLLELMIAFFLVSLCSLPLIHSPLRLVRQEIASLQNIELSRQAECAFAEIKEQLYNRTISWDMLPKEIQEVVPQRPSSFSFSHQHLGQRSWKETRHLILEAKCGEIAQEEVRKILVKIAYEPVKDTDQEKRVFSYRLLVKHAHKPS